MRYFQAEGSGGANSSVLDIENIAVMEQDIPQLDTESDDLVKFNQEQQVDQIEPALDTLNQLQKDAPPERVFSYKGETCTESELRDKCPFLGKLGKAAFQATISLYEVKPETSDTEQKDQGLKESDQPKEKRLPLKKSIVEKEANSIKAVVVNAKPVAPLATTKQATSIIAQNSERSYNDASIAEVAQLQVELIEQNHRPEKEIVDKQLSIESEATAPLDKNEDNQTVADPKDAPIIKHKTNQSAETLETSLPKSEDRKSVV